MRLGLGDAKDSPHHSLIVSRVQSDHGIFKAKDNEPDDISNDKIKECTLELKWFPTKTPSSFRRPTRNGAFYASDL